MSASGSVRGLVDAVRRNERASGRVVLQGALAGGLSWWISSSVLHAPQVIFGPFAALAVLLGGEGGRGKRAVQVVFSVVVGVGFGELLVGLLDRGPLSVVLVALLAMTAVAMVTVDSLPLIQSAVAAVIVVAMHSPATGVGRLGSALIGAAIALLFSQVLFSPNPVRLLANSVGEVVEACAELIDLTARAPHDTTADRGPERHRLLSALSSLTSTRATAEGMSRRTLRGRRVAGRVRELDRRSAALEGVALDIVTRHRHAELTGERVDPTDLRTRLDDQTHDELMVAALSRTGAPARVDRG